MFSIVLAAAIAASVSGTAPGKSVSDFTLLKGRVIITQRSSESVVIAVDEDGNGYADHLFWFFSTQAPALNVRTESALVEWRGDELVVISGDSGDLVSFTVGKPQVAQRGIGSGAAFAAYSGYGLNHVIGPNVSRVRMPSQPPHAAGRVTTLDFCEDGCIYNLDYGGAGGGGTCDAGGQGATSCSVSSQSGDQCQVTCGSGYYACCTRNTMGPSTCNCVKY